MWKSRLSNRGRIKAVTLVIAVIMSICSGVNDVSALQAQGPSVVEFNVGNKKCTVTIGWHQPENSGNLVIYSANAVCNGAGTWNEWRLTVEYANQSYPGDWKDSDADEPRFYAQVDPAREVPVGTGVSIVIAARCGSAPSCSGSASGSGGTGPLGQAASNSAGDTTTFRELRVTRLYETLLLRSPDQGGFDFWTSRSCSTYWQSWVGQAFVNAALDNGEFIASLGVIQPGDIRWKQRGITRIYLALFGRRPEPGGLDFWTETVSTVQDFELIAIEAMKPGGEWYNHTLEGCGYRQGTGSYL